MILELGDERDASRDFTCGIAMEATETDQSVSSRTHFVVPRGSVADVPAVAPGDLVRTLRDFRASVREIPQARLFDAGTYRDELRHRLGTLPEAFHRLIVKALDFKPIGEVRDFVFNYLLDPRPVDTQTLQASLEHYKQLEAQARDAERHLAALDAVCAQGERIAQERRTAESHRYLWMRADVELVEARERQAEEAIGATELRQATLGAEPARADQQLAFLAGERDRLTTLLLGTPGCREIQALERDLDETRRAVTAATDAEARARRILTGQAAALDTLLSQDARDLRRARPGLFADEALVGAAEQPAVVARLSETLARDGALGGRDLATWTRRLGAAEAVSLARLRLGDRLDAGKQEGRALEAEQAELERGRLRYPDGAEALLHLLRTRLRGAREPRALAELIEVLAARWRDAAQRRPEIAFRHWGDADLGGLRIWWLLCTRVDRPVALVRTTAAWLEDAAARGGKPLGDGERWGLELRGQLLASPSADAPDVTDAVALIDALLRLGVKVEQERY